MPWNPEIYNQFKEIRYKPFFDLMNLISSKDLKDAVDIGCGTGEQTSILSKEFEDANFLGIDGSAEMLGDAVKLQHENLRFDRMTIEDFVAAPSQWDLIFSNAALQWSDNHKVLFPELISKLNPGGQFAIQMPFQHENILNKILMQIAGEKPLVDFLDGYSRTSPVLSIDEYAAIMFQNGLQDLNISMKVYPIIASSETELYNFISGSALIPYMERLDTTAQGLMRATFIERIKIHFPEFPAIYSFKRLLLYGVKR